VSPILGIYASQISGHLFAPSGAYDSIATTTLTSATSTVTFSSIPSTYTHLQLRYIARGTTTNNDESVLWQMNGLSSNGNYTRHSLWGEGAVAQSGADTNSNGGLIQMPSGGNLSNTFGAGVIDVLDYASTSKNKTIRAFGGFDTNNSTNGQAYHYISLNSNLAITQGTTATTSFTFTCYVYAGGSGFAVGSSFALYGIRGN